MGCCSVRHTGVDEVGPDEIELLELSGDNLGVWNLGETRLQLSVRNTTDQPLLPPPYPPVGHLEPELDLVPPSPGDVHPAPAGLWGALWGMTREELHLGIYSQKWVRNWEGQPPHMYGQIIHSALVLLCNHYTQETSPHFLVLFSFHLLILSLDHPQQEFLYEGILPLSGLSFQPVSLDTDASHSAHMFEIRSPVVESKVFICPSAAELQKWLQHIEDRRYKSMTQPLSPSHCALSYLLPCDEHWKREELKKYLLQAPIWQWEGSPIQHLGPPGFISVVHIINTQRQGVYERLMVLFPQDVLLLSVDNKQLNIRYEGRLPRYSIRAVELSALPGCLKFDLIGELMEPLQVSCTCLEDYQNWIFHLQQPGRSSHNTESAAPPPIKPKLYRSRKESQEATAPVQQCHANGHS